MKHENCDTVIEICSKLKQTLESCNQAAMSLQHKLAPLHGEIRASSDMARQSNKLLKSSLEILAKSLLQYGFGIKHKEAEPSADISKLLEGLLGGGRKIGGNVAGGGSYLVGERGAEVFTPHMSGTITPNGRGKAAAPINLVINIYTPDAGSFKKNQGQVLAEAASSLRRAGRYL
jgi:hypothetical protein